MRRLAAEEAAKEREHDRQAAADLANAFLRLTSEYRSLRLIMMALELVAANVIIAHAHHIAGPVTVDDFIAGVAEDIRVEVERLQPSRVF